MAERLDAVVINGSEYSFSGGTHPLSIPWSDLSIIPGSGYPLYATGMMSSSSATETSRYLINDNYRKVSLYAGMDGTKDALVDELAIAFYKGTELSTENYLKEASVRFIGEGSELTGRWYSAEVPANCVMIVFSNRAPTCQNPECKIYGETEAVFDDIYQNIDNIKKSSSQVPSFVLSDARKTYKRIVEWADTEDVYLLAQVTDVHSGGSEKYKVVEYLSVINQLYSFDVLCNMGDIGLDTSATTGDEEKVFDMLWNTRKGMNCTNPWIFCKGNHERLVNLQTLGNIFNRSFKRQFPQIQFGDTYGNYGYIDCAEKKVRTYFLNTSDTLSDTQYAMSKEQLQWLIESLLTLSDTWRVIVTSHLCVDDIGRWKSYPTDAAGDAFDSFRAILHAFVTRTSGTNTSLGLTWDFTKAKGTLVCSLAGDSHFNAYINRDGVNYIVRQGYSAVGDSELPSWGTRAPIYWTTQCSFDVLAVKNNGTAKVFRIGSGDSDYDLSFSY